jgi:hypothetical protein
MGPSPRVRGSPRLIRTEALCIRSIPACAGEPAFRQPEPGQCGVHPACAGEPSALATPEAWRWVHPRVCGGAKSFNWTKSRWTGPSPRVRGSRYLRYTRPPKPGSIPACAGEPHRQSAPDCSSRVHPRVCGGANIKGVTIGQATGPSPRVRGSLWGVTCRTTSQFQTAGHDLCQSRRVTSTPSMSANAREGSPRLATPRRPGDWSSFQTIRIDPPGLVAHQSESTVQTRSRTPLERSGEVNTPVATSGMIEARKP